LTSLKLRKGVWRRSVATGCPRTFDADRAEASRAQSSPPAAQQPAESPAQSESNVRANLRSHRSLSRFASRSDRVAGVSPEEAASLLAATPLKRLRPSPAKRCTMHAGPFLPRTFSDIQAEVRSRRTAGVRLRFLTVANFFVAMVTIEGFRTIVPRTNWPVLPAYNSAKSSPEKTGSRFSQASNESWKKKMEFPLSKVTISEQRAEQQYQSSDLPCASRARAVVGEITLGRRRWAVPSPSQGDRRTPSGGSGRSNRITRACNAFAVGYQKQDRLLAQVEVAGRTYNPERHTVDYVSKSTASGGAGCAGRVSKLHASAYEKAGANLRKKAG